MSGYAASARLHGGVPRFAGVAAIELVGHPLDERLAACWADLCEAWSQTTHFLMDPEVLALMGRSGRDRPKV